jgi:predicted pyridoxine 5'-phosphate oxidase superfamily flavin-nucleotide-binding protein
MFDDAAITDDLRAFLATIDTAFLATADASGQPYVQHRGGPKGFIRALDDHTLAFVDYNGNRQYLSTGNLRENNKVCLFLIDYAHRQRVKVWGTMREEPVTPELLARLAPIPPKTRAERVLLLTVTRWDINCPKHIPMKINAEDVAATIEKLQARIAELEKR